MAYDDLTNNFGYGSNTSPSFFTPSNDAFDASKAWGPSSNWSASNYDWSNKNPNNPDFTSMLKSQAFGGNPTERDKYSWGVELAKAIPKAISAFGGQPSYGDKYGNQQRGYGSGSSDESELSSNNGTVRKAGDLIFVTPPPQQYATTQQGQSLGSKILGAASILAAPIPGAGPFISAGLGAARQFV